MICRLTKPLTRRIGRLIVRMEKHGLELRGYRCRKRYFVPWSRIGALLEDLDRPAVTLPEEALGRIEFDQRRMNYEDETT